MSTQIQLSEGVRNLLEQAAAAANLATPADELSSSYIFAALWHLAAAQPNTLVADICNDLGAQSGIQQIEKEFRDHLSRFKGTTASVQRTLTPNAARMLARAEQLRLQVGLSGGVRLRHLLASLFTFDEAPSSNLWVRLQRAGVKLETYRGRFLKLVQPHISPDELVLWQRALLPGTAAGTSPSPRAQPGEGAAAVPAITDADHAAGPTIADYAADLAAGVDQLDITRDAVAMANLIASRALQPPLSIGVFGNWGTGKSFFMGRLQEECEGITQAAKADPAGSFYWTGIVHVRFNAWNYVDANLWAGLVSHLFEQLGSWNKPLPNAFEQARRDEITKLSLATQAREEANGKLATATRARQEAEQARQTCQKDAELDRKAFVTAVARDVWEKVSTSEIETSPELKRHLENVGLASADLDRSKRQVYEQLKELTTLSGRVRAVWVALAGGTRLPGRNGWLAAAVVLLVLALCLLAWLPPLGWFLGVCGEMAVATAAAAAWVRAGAGRVAEFLKPARQALGAMEAALQKAENEKAAEVAQLERQLRERQAEYELALSESAAAAARVAEAEAELAAVHTGRLISRFIDRRVASGDYRKHLGIVSTIRDDFSALDQLVTGYNDFLSGHAGAGGMPTEEAARAAGAMGINRIVLYIDDLDRCPPERVVEVLQAIHLLLAFPLFVVVVAVDVRWVAHALRSQYPHLSEETGGAATARDYLEKLFQIPFWIPLMTADGGRQLIKSLVSVDATPLPYDTWREADAPSQASPPAPSAGTADGPPLGPLPPPTPEPQAEVHASRLAPARLCLTQSEVDAMTELAPLIGRSPRETKRFVNIYRLMKSALPGDRVAEFVGAEGREGTCRYPLMLLAIMTGVPRLARGVFEGCSGANSPVGSDEGTLKHVVTAAHTEGTSPANDADWRRLVAFLDGHPRWAKLDARELRRWIGRASQFTFEPTAGWSS